MAVVIQQDTLSTTNEDYYNDQYHYDYHSDVCRVGFDLVSLHIHITAGLRRAGQHNNNPGRHLPKREGKHDQDNHLSSKGAYL